jgi:hypothetical protein
MLWFVSYATKSMRGCDGVEYTSRSSDLLHVEASLARISQSSLKSGRGVMAGGVRGTIAEVVSELS